MCAQFQFKFIVLCTQYSGLVHTKCGSAVVIKCTLLHSHRIMFIGTSDTARACIVVPIHYIIPAKIGQ